MTDRTTEAGPDTREPGVQRSAFVSREERLAQSLEWALAVIERAYPRRTGNFRAWYDKSLALLRLEIIEWPANEYRTSIHEHSALDEESVR
jgi:hypothetical protein